MRVLLLYRISNNFINVVINYLRERGKENKTAIECYRSYRNPSLSQVLLIEKPYNEI